LSTNRNTHSDQKSDLNSSNSLQHKWTFISGLYFVITKFLNEKQSFWVVLLKEM
jgi:hypothetical protein